MKSFNFAPACPLISIVDDDPSMRNSTCQLVRSLGFRAEAFASVREFLDSSSAEASASLILDVRMPDIEGLELQRQLAAAKNGVPVIFVTTHADEEKENRARAKGAIDFLRKPVSQLALLHALDMALRRGSHDRTGHRHWGLNE